MQSSVLMVKKGVNWLKNRNFANAVFPKLYVLLLLRYIFSPFQGEVLKQNRNSDPRARLVLPSVNDPNSLVLQVSSYF